MKEGVLFEFTRENLDMGLRGVPVGYCTTSHVDPHKGLFYVGRSITEVSYWDPIEVIYLLYYGHVGNKEQVLKFRAELHHRAACKPALLSQIASLPRQG